MNAHYFKQIVVHRYFVYILLLSDVANLLHGSMWLIETIDEQAPVRVHIILNRCRQQIFFVYILLLSDVANLLHGFIWLNVNHTITFNISHTARIYIIEQHLTRRPSVFLLKSVYVCSTHNFGGSLYGSSQIWLLNFLQWQSIVSASGRRLHLTCLTLWRETSHLFLPP